MNEKLKSVFTGRKLKAAGTAICAALVLTAGAVTAYAADNVERHHIHVRSVGGVSTFSVDGGATWMNTAPEGFVQLEGYAQIEGGTFFAFTQDFEGEMGLAIREENGIIYFSTDGGVTWSDEFPEGLESFQFIDGDINYTRGYITFTAENRADWDDMLPNNVIWVEGEDGSITFKLLP